MRKKYNLEYEFSENLIEWYCQHKRNLPWRLTQNPYHIWLSEVILQQTRVDQGLPYYNNFIEKYPLVENLAAAEEDEVLLLWQGLGYYSRARNLHYAAKYIVEHFDGVFPESYKDVRSLKGVGEYTAAAIMSFAYNKPYAAVDGNVYRVLSRIYGIDEFIDTSEGKKKFSELAFELLDKNNPGLYNQAIMDFGALQCVPKSPNCSDCPFSEKCYAFYNNKVDALPRKKGKVNVRYRFFNYVDIRLGETRWLRKREGGDIWEGLYEFPLIESEKKYTFLELINSDRFKALLPTSESMHLKAIKEYKHVLSHQVIYAAFFRLEINDADRLIADYIKIEEKDLNQYAVPRLIEKYLLDD